MSRRSIGLRHRHALLAALASLLLAVNAAAAQVHKGAKADREDLAIDPDSVTMPWTGDLDRMIERRIVRVLVVPSKTFYFNDRGTQRGVVYDTFQLVEKELEKQIAREKKPDRKHLTVTFFYVSVGRDQILTALRDGKGDIAAANLTVTPARRELVEFAAPHMTGIREVVVTGPKSPAVKSLDDLAGKVVFVRKSSSYYEHLLALNERFAVQKRPPVKLQEAPDELEDEDLIEMLNAGLVPMLVVDKHKADFWKKVFPNIQVHDEIAVNSGGVIAWAMRKNSPRLKAFLDRVVGAVTAGPLARQRERILAQYLVNTGYVKNSAGDAERRKFLALVELFRKYGNRYDVDWILMAAQGYQESRLNQNARGPTGAIGIMQVMPATGKDLNVGDITQTEANIHAGVKYMRVTVDTFFKDEPMTALDKLLFGFAAYNCGPGRVTQLRREAARRGLDANVWFHNVEYVAEEKIGRETVTYVSNIFKYYIAYLLMQEALEERAETFKKLKGNSK